jgi:hypothetical protein
MRIPVVLTIVLASVALAVIVGAVWLAVNGDTRILREASFSQAEISPNADGSNDATQIRYWLNRDATVSIYFIAEDGERYYFRQDRERSRSQDEPYSVLFSGVVNGYQKRGDTFTGSVLARLMPDGRYTWVIAADEKGTARHAEITGTLVVAGGDPVLPELRGFTISPPEITPNRDGISDRAAVNYYLNKDLNRDPNRTIGSVQVYLLGPDGVRYDIPEKESVNPPGARGEHTYDYAGGVDEGATPPPDGAYAVHAAAEDDTGQRVEVTGTLRIAGGGVPRADIVAPAVGDQIEFSSAFVSLGQTLYFTATVENFGDADIRTTGPWPGTCYDLDQNYNTLGFPDQSGAFRIGIDFDTSPRNYPFRWAVGSPEDLVEKVIDGQTFYYLPEGARAQVTGCIRMTYEPKRNPLYFWGGLIHQDVEITQFNNRVDPHSITIGAP